MEPRASQGGAAPSAGRLEFQTTNLWAGAFVLGALFLFSTLALMSLRDRILGGEYQLNASFTRIEGLRAGAEVLLRGYQVGRVTDIRLTTVPEIRFDVELTVADHVRLPVGSRARLAMRGFGNRVVDIVTPGDPTDPDAPATSTAQAYLADGDTIPSGRSTDLDALLEDVVGLARGAILTLERVDGLLEDQVGPAVETVSGFFVEDLAEALEELRATSVAARQVAGEAEALIAESRPRARRVLDEAGDTLEAAEEILLQADQFLGELEGQIEPLVEELLQGARRAEALLERADRAATDEDLATIMTNMKKISEDGAALLEELRERPWRMVRRLKGEKKALVKQLEEQRRLEEQLRRLEEGAEPPAP